MHEHSEFKDFRAALRIQVRVIGALVLREMRVRYGRSQAGYLWALIEPAAYIAAFSAMFIYAEHPAPFGQNMPLFFALGTIPFRLFIALGNQLGGAFNANEALLTFPIVKKVDTIIARWILEVISSVAVLILVLLALHILTDTPWPHRVLRMVEGIGLIASFGFGVGLINAVLTTYVDSWQNIFRMTTLPLMFLSGVFYSISSVPSKIREIVIWNPILHGVEIVRDGYYSNYRSDAIDEGYLLTFCIVSILIGLMFERAARGGRS